MLDIIRRSWGKARPSPGGGPSWHPLVYHCLDVAAVAAVLLDRHPALARHLSLVSGLEVKTARRWLILVAILHDLGKTAPGFQAKSPVLFAALRGRDDRPADRPHGQTGLAFWQEQSAVYSLIEARLGALGLEGRPAARWREALDWWMRAAAGHHGSPVIESGGIGSDLFDAVSAADALALIEGALVLTDPFVGLVGPGDPERAKRASWLVAGLLILCDWIGSNQGWFPYTDPTHPVEVYWSEVALKRAAGALDRSGILPAPPRRCGAPEDFFPGLPPALTPLQDHAATVGLAEEPQLHLFEDLTGSGKTEAALILARRLMAAGLADGVFMALPTMATANAMYRRLAEVLPAFFGPGTKPSLVLSHGARELSDAFSQSVLPVSDAAGERYGDGEETASAACAAWIADDRRKAFLADIGVGTVDQAILAVLPSRHQALRLAGLARKVLILDEVHAYDAYMTAELEALLGFQASLGGSAVLLSATLPQAQRCRYAAAFAAGRGQRVKPVLMRTEYPLATAGSGGSWTEQPIASRRGARRDLAVERVARPEDALARLIARAGNGSAVCWIRNTVDDAVETARGLHAQAPDLSIHLFHARFAMADRLAREERIVTLFGRESTASQRRGQVLIATQVVEQSLDLDFDDLVTDLAPIDLLIQRAGRLWRHERNERTGEPVLTLLAPDPGDEAGDGWYARLLPHAAFVYEDHGRLWLTARLLQERGAIRLPDEARRLIEGVYAPDADQRIPAGLQRRYRNAEGKRSAEGTAGDQVCLDRRKGYCWDGTAWEEDRQVETRLGAERVIFRLARWDGSTLRSWAADRDPWRAWRLSEIALRAGRAAAEAPASGGLAVAIAATKAGWPDRQSPPPLLALTPAAEGEWRGEVVARNGQVVPVVYDSDTGLRFSDVQR